MVRDRYEGEAMARLMSLIMAVFLLVPIVAPGVGAGLNAIAPWRIVFVTPGVLAVGLLLWARRLPETLTPDRRRPFTWAAVGEAGRLVVTNRQTVCFMLAITCLFGVMTSFLAGSELIIEDVYGYGSWFPLFFGGVAVLLAFSSLNNARLVGRLGLTTLVRRMSVTGVVLALVLLAVSFTGSGKPNFWLFTLLFALVIAMAQGLLPSCNTAAMAPLPQVAGTASTIIATVSTAGGALLGGVVSNAFDGTVRPFAVGIAAYVSIAAALILLGATGSSGRRVNER
jgi:DHA1 family bicyclomycin/chloramphenicol resistance-like MFS transporter